MVDHGIELLVGMCVMQCDFLTHIHLMRVRLLNCVSVDVLGRSTVGNIIMLRRLQIG